MDKKKLIVEVNEFCNIRENKDRYPLLIKLLTVIVGFVSMMEKVDF